MGKTLHLHIGTEKTGTTTIQSFLKNNRSELIANGIGVSALLGEQQDIRLPAAFCLEDGHLAFFLSELKVSKEEIHNKRMQWQQAFREEVEGSTCEEWIISSEHLHARLRRADEIESLYIFLDSIFDKINVLIYLRNPIDAAISLMSTSVICGNDCSTLPNPGHPYWNNLCDHESTIKRWTLGGKRQIDVRLFEPDFLRGGSLILDFFYQVNIPGHLHRIPVETENTSMSRDAITVLAELNKFIPWKVDGVYNKNRKNLAEYIRKEFNSSGSYIPTEEEQKIYAEHYRSSNEWVRLNFFPERMDLFSGLQSRKVKPSFFAPELTAAEEKLCSIIAKIWNNCAS